MCGIAGVWSKSSRNSSTDLRDMVRKMSNTLQHRGPDGEGVWLDEENGVALGHRRLAIVDLSDNGSQPMISSCGRFVITYNGEVYNSLALSRILEKDGIQLKGHSDTEVLLESCAKWGIEQTLARAVGMFAFALWDRAAKNLYLVRDRMGEKPLYYGWVGDMFVFTSELKTLKKIPEFTGEVDRGAMKLLQRFSYIPSPHCIYKGIKKLPPASMATVRHETKSIGLRSYWDITKQAEISTSKLVNGSEEEVLEVLHSKLSLSVAGQMMADVPLGAFLSGGVDSSLITALMQERSTKPVQTFTIGFHEENFNEAIYAKQVAQILGTEHTEVYLQSSDALAVIPELPQLFDEPFADSSQIPTYLLSKVAKQTVSVCLSGDGGDELFGGYNRYLWGDRMWRVTNNVPKNIRQILAKLITQVPPRRWDQIYGMIELFIPKRARMANPGDKAHKFAGLIVGEGLGDRFLDMVSYWKNVDELAYGGSELATCFSNLSSSSALTGFAQQMMLLDQKSYLPDDLMVKVDRVSMGVSLETRAPFLDHRLIEYAWQLPQEMKIRNGHGKWLLKKLLGRYIPKELVERPKMGFQPPIGQWLRGPLREWSESLLDESRLNQEGYINSSVIQRYWKEHLSGDHNWAGQLWTVLMFQAWLAAQ